MAFGDNLWASCITGIDFDVMTMTLRVSARTEAADIVGSHVLSLDGISRLTVSNQLELPMWVAEIRDFGIRRLPNQRIMVEFEVSDQVAFEVECEAARMDGELF